MAGDVARGDCIGVLLAEDEAPVLTLMCGILEHAGYRVLEATTGAEAPVVASDFDDPIHLVVSDVVMPELSGPEMMEALSDARPQTKVIFVSGYADDVLSKSGLRVGEHPLLKKPFANEALLDKVREVLDSD